MRECKKLEYKVCFATPAFLAGAVQQESEWRTPPFKALLREWWRVVKAPEVGYDPDKLRDAEHKLFGHAGSKENSGQSLIRLRLEHWNQGTEEKLHASLRDIKLSAGKFPSPAAVYLGYGPIQNTTSRHAISNGNDSNTLSLIVPLDVAEQIRRTMQLVAWFGAVGSRARNSWGSLTIEGEEVKNSSALSTDELGNSLRDWKDCLELDWPHAIGKDDNGPLIWKTEPHSDWKQALKNIANLRSGVRALFHLDQQSRLLQARHILAYPIKQPVVSVWENQTRIPNQLRLKIICEGGKYRGIVTHVPCALPQQLAAKLDNNQARNLKEMQHKVWEIVHNHLDSPVAKLTRVN
jgi:CRISPR-associated protein Cmr1